jgi:heme A synthase
VAWYALIGRADRFAVRAGAGRTALFGGGLALLALVGVAGAIVALGDTLFPSASLAEGLRQDLSPAAHFLVRLRVIHPLLAVATAGYLVLMASLVRLRDPRLRTARLAGLVVALVGIQLALGMFNLALLAPVWLQLGHLLVADLTWIAVVVLALHSLADAEPVTRVAELAAAPG